MPRTGEAVELPYVICIGPRATGARVRCLLVRPTGAEAREKRACATRGRARGRGAALLLQTHGRHRRGVAEMGLAAPDEAVAHRPDDPDRLVDRVPARL